jgi:hypothetical protein
MHEKWLESNENAIKNLIYYTDASKTKLTVKQVQQSAELMVKTRKNGHGS